MKPRTYRLRLKLEELEPRDAPSGAITAEFITPPPVLGCFIATPAGLVRVPSVVVGHNPNAFCLGG
jgi:hypothetical protein